MFSFLFAWQKLNEYDFLKGNAFYGVYTYGIKIPSLQENSSYFLGHLVGLIENPA
jgi:hypothetical protein